MSIEKNVANILTISPGGAMNSHFKDFLSKIGLIKVRKYDIHFHRKLEQHFPDWDRRIAYQEKQEQFYMAAMRRQREAHRLRIRKPNFTKEELDAMDYFKGSGFYKYHQDPKRKPNVYDTRQSFLLKMHDAKMRRDFLENYRNFP